MLIMKCWKRETMERIEQPNQESIRMLEEKENYKYLEILEVNIIKQTKMKEKIRKKYLRRMRNLLKTKLYCRNLIKRTNTWSVHFVRYLRSFLKWTREELGPMDQKTRKFKTMHKALHPRDDTDRLCVK